MKKELKNSDIMNKVLLNSDIKPFTTECSRCYEKITFTRGTVHSLYCFHCLVIMVNYNMELLGLEKKKICNFIYDE